MKTNWPRLVGGIGVLVCLIFFIHEPSWPTPDKILIFLTFAFMCFGQAREMLKRFVPFIAILLVYESFRGLIPNLNTRINFSWAPAMDQKIFGVLPTAKLQQWLWHGYVRWYDMVFYLTYMLHFVLPIFLAVLVWKKDEASYWKFISTYIILSFAGFVTYLAFPAAPPWMASDNGTIAPISHLAGAIWTKLGIHNFTLAYSKINPNPEAAIPSLHAGFAVLFSIFVFKYFGKRWGFVSLIYPILIFVGTMYMGEHYAIDLILGCIYAFGAYYFTEWSFKAVMPRLKIYMRKFATVKENIENI